jgi:hypothetical protein
MREISKKGGYMKKTHIISIIVIVCLLALPVIGSALPISGQGTYGSFSGEIYYYAENSNAAYLKLSLTNTSPGTKYVYLAGLAFSDPSIMGAWSEGTGSLVQDTLSQDASNGVVQIDFGLAKEVALSLVLKGEKLDTLTAESLVSNFVVFFSDGKYTVDKVSVSVSEPFTVILLGFGLLVLGIAARRKL